MVAKMQKNGKNGPDGRYSLVAGAESANTVLTTSQMVVTCGDCTGGKFRNLDGMNWLITCLFIVGETAGGGLIALPAAMVSTGLVGGFLILIFGAVVCTITGIQLSENWTILQERWPEFRNHCRKPYPSMGLKAIGPRFMTTISCCLNITMFGTAVVFLLLASKNIESFLQTYFGIRIGFCVLIIIVAVCMLPITFLKSPKDFWWAVIAAMITTSIAVVLILYGSSLDFDECSKHANYPSLTLSRFFMSFGTVMFAYGGHGAFPTIQHDMKKPYRFKRSVCFAFLIVLCLYIPVSLMGYVTYGDSLQHSIIPSIQSWPIQQMVNILITLHVILALTIIFNPLNQELEEFLNVPHDWGIQRFLSRTGMMAATVVVAETVPNFGVLLDLVGGSTVTLMALVFPVVFNIYLAGAKNKFGSGVADPEEMPLTFFEAWKHTPTKKKVVNALVILFAVIGGTAATVAALQAMLGSEFSLPCYAGIFTSSNPTQIDSNSISVAQTDVMGLFNCCGASRNITRFGLAGDFCGFSALLTSNVGGHG